MLPLCMLMKELKYGAELHVGGWGGCWFRSFERDSHRAHTHTHTQINKLLSCRRVTDWHYYIIKNDNMCLRRKSGLIRGQQTQYWAPRQAVTRLGRACTKNSFNVSPTSFFTIRVRGLQGYIIVVISRFTCAMLSLVWENWLFALVWPWSYHDLFDRET